MTSDAKPILIIVAAAAAVVLIVLALRGTTIEIEVLPPVGLPPPGEVGPDGAPIAVVTAKREDQETSLFGLWKRRTHYLVDVQFYAPAGCSNRVAQDDPWPPPNGECSIEVAVTGVIAGLGVAATGETIILVEVETAEACFDFVEPGDFWPPDLQDCAEPVGTG